MTENIGIFLKKQKSVEEIILAISQANPELEAEAFEALRVLLEPFINELCSHFESEIDSDSQDFSGLIGAGLKATIIFLKSGGTLRSCFQTFKLIRSKCDPGNEDIQTHQSLTSFFDDLELTIADYWEKRLLQDFSITNIYGESVALYENAFMNNHSTMLIIDPDNGQILDANRAASEYYGYSIKTLKSMVITDINLLTDPEIRFEMAKASSTNRTSFQFRHRLASGEIRDVEVKTGPIQLQGKSCLFSIVYDVTEQKKAQKYLTENEERLRKFMDAVDETIVLFDESLNLIEFNKAAEELFPGAGVHINQHLSLLFDKFLEEYNLIEIFKAQSSDEAYVFQTTLRSPNSAETHLEIDAFRVGTGLAVIIRDISKQKQYEYNLQFSAHHDPLTKLPNRTLFYDRLGQAIKKASRNDSKLAVLFIDLDGFKAVNDLFGHEVGDEVLTEIGQSLKESLRESDTVARIGGDEFTILLEKVNTLDNAEAIAKKILQAITRSVDRSEGSIFITASIGISLFPDHSIEIEDLIQIADQAMYKAKNSSTINISFP